MLRLGLRSVSAPLLSSSRCVPSLSAGRFISKPSLSLVPVRRAFSSTPTPVTPAGAGAGAGAGKQEVEGMSMKLWHIAVVGGLSWFALQQYQEISVGRGFYPPQYDVSVSTGRLIFLRLLCSRALSRLWGDINEKELYDWQKRLLFSAWAKAFDCHLDEMLYPLEHYKNLAEFFARPLKPGLRPIESNKPGDLVSPVDARMILFGEVQGDRLEQIKGYDFSLSKFLGEADARKTIDRSRQERIDAIKKTLSGKGVSKADRQSLEGELKSLEKEKKLYYAVMYLAPGDYHNIHSPVDWKVQNRKHFPGEVFPVNAWATKFCQDLFVVNERVVSNGRWSQGYFSMAAVGAYNVGSIQLFFDQDLLTNLKQQDDHLAYLAGPVYTKEFESGVPMTKGDEFAAFRLGSCVVLVFESPNFSFTVKEGDKIKVGQLLGTTN